MRSCRTISCNNTSRRVHFNSLREPTDDDDIHRQVRIEDEQVRKGFKRLLNNNSKRAK